MSLLLPAGGILKPTQKRSPVCKRNRGRNQNQTLPTQRQRSLAEPFQHGQEYPGDSSRAVNFTVLKRLPVHKSRRAAKKKRGRWMDGLLHTTTYGNLCHCLQLALHQTPLTLLKSSEISSCSDFSHRPVTEGGGG